MNLHSESGCPEAVLASIAWYPDALDDERRGLVESHAAQCADCREELAFVQGDALPEASLPDPDAVYERVLARIEESETPATPAGEPLVSAPAPPRRSRSAFGARPAALAAGIALALFCGAVGALGALLWSGEPTYQTVSAPTSNAAIGGVPHLDVVFRDEVRAEQVRSALRAIGGQVVAGPTQLGVYRVELAPTADVTAAARVLQGEGQGVATFAQPTPR